MELMQTTATHIAALLERVGRLLTTEAHAIGLLPVQWEVLRYLDRANRFSQTAAALTAYLGITKGTVSQTLNALEAKGLVRKKIDTRDKRRKQLHLTAKGINRLSRDPLGATVAAIQEFENPTQKILSEKLESLLIHRLGARDRRAFGQCRDCRYFALQHPKGRPHFCLLLEETLAKSEAHAICHEQEPQ
jgi:DNA-binding MarR family transcriptional regulator